MKRLAMRAELFLKVTNTSFSNFIDSKLVLEHMLGAEHLPLTLLVDAQGMRELPRASKRSLGRTLVAEIARLLSPHA